MTKNYTALDDPIDLFSDRWWHSVSDDGLINEFPGGPDWLLSIIFSYLTFVLLVGPKIMKNREPFDLQTPMKVYNLVNIVCNTGVIFIGLKFTNYGVKSFTCSNDGGFERYALFVSYLALKVTQFFKPLHFKHSYFLSQYRFLTFVTLSSLCCVKNIPKLPRCM